MKVLVGNTVNSGHHAKVVSSSYPLNKIKRKKKKKMKEKNKGKSRLGKICIHDRYNSPSTKAPTDNIMHLWLSLHLHVWISPRHITSLTWLR
jgi:hypothetical protein